MISHAIRTNTNLWICLRVVTESESMEILGTRDAARIPDGSPGRAIIRLGAGQDLRTFQAARIARPVPDEESPVRVTRLRRWTADDSRCGSPTRPSSTSSSAASRTAAAELGLETSRAALAAAAAVRPPRRHDVPDRTDRRID